MRQHTCFFKFGKPTYEHCISKATLRFQRHPENMLLPCANNSVQRCQNLSQPVQQKQNVKDKIEDTLEISQPSVQVSLLWKALTRGLSSLEALHVHRILSASFSRPHLEKVSPQKVVGDVSCCFCSMVVGCFPTPDIDAQSSQR